MPIFIIVIKNWLGLQDNPVGLEGEVKWENVIIAENLMQIILYQYMQVSATTKLIYLIALNLVKNNSYGTGNTQKNMAENCHTYTVACYLQYYG